MQARDFRLTVLNPNGGDPDQAFPHGAGAPDASVHAPVNFHAYAASTSGHFLKKTERAIELGDPVLLLVRSDPSIALKALAALEKKGIPTAVSFKECGLHQLADQLSDPKALSAARQLFTACGRAVAATPECEPFYRALGAKQVLRLPTPYPVDDSRWDFSIPMDQRRGILIGTREFEVPSRNHLLALSLLRDWAVETGTPLSVFLSKRESRAGKILDALHYPEALLIRRQAGMRYVDYLRIVASHRLVFQLDRSSVPGQVAGDSLLAGIPCVGGNGAVDRAVFPQWSGDLAPDEALEIVAKLMKNPGMDDWNTLRSAASERHGFAAARSALAEFFA